MRTRPVLPLIAVLGMLGCGADAGPDDARAEYLGSFTWERPEDYFGGVSAIEVAEDGVTFLAIGDSGQTMDGRLIREGDAITGVSMGWIGGLRTTSGVRVEEDQADAEGVTRLEDGSFWISFEMEPRVWFYQNTEAAARPLPLHPDFGRFEPNRALEALARDQNGTIYAIPEGAQSVAHPFPVYRYRDGAWDIPFRLSRRNGYLPVGADFGPDGRLYVLERKFMGVFGFSSRVRSFAVEDDGLTDEREELVSAGWAHDNLEGLTVWRDAAGDLRLLMVSDDNYLPIQRTELVEYRLTR